MKSSDVVNQLAVNLPLFSDKFTANLNVTSLDRVGSVATVITSIVHGLVAGNQVNIIGAQSPISITTIVRSGTIGTLTTLIAHDLTERKGLTVDLSGVVEPEFNGTFAVINIPDRNTVNFTMTDTGPLVGTGPMLLLNGSSYLQSWNGLFEVVSVPTTNSFTYALVNIPPLFSATGAISTRANPRISAAISQERVVDAYTQHNTNELWAFVTLGDVIASKSRKIDSDAVANIQRGEEWRQQLIQPFTIMVIIPASQEIAGRTARDLAEDLFAPICKSIVGHKFDSGLFVGAQNPVAFVDHGFALYNTAIYVHTYSFEQVADLTFDDTVGYDDDVAFRDIDTSIFVDVGTKEDSINAVIDLDGT